MDFGCPQPETNLSLESTLQTNIEKKCTFASEYTTKLPFRSFADRYLEVKAVASLRNATKNWQSRRRTDLAAVGAIMNGDMEKLAKMLRNGQDPNARLHTAGTGAANIRYDEQLSGTHPSIFPLTLAAEQGFLNGIDMLLCAGADINAVDENCRSALDWAMTRGNEKACAALLARGARYVERGDRRVENGRAYLQAARDSLIRDLIAIHRRVPKPERLDCHAHHAILYMDGGSFKTLLSYGFSIHSKPMCGTHGTRSFCDLAQDLAPHLLDTSNSPQELDLMLLLEAITANDVPAIRNLFRPAVTLPLWMSSPDALLDFTRATPGISQEAINVLASAVRWVGLPTPPQEDNWYSRFDIPECNWRREVGEVPAALRMAFEQYTEVDFEQIEDLGAFPTINFR